MTTITLALLALVGFAIQHVVDPAICPLHAAHTPHQAQSHAHHEQMNARGTKAMGFDQTRASHHFKVLPDGGAIEIHVNDPGDEDTRRRIVAHLQDIERQFKAGAFGIPLATHGEEPAGAAEMSRLRNEIEYAFEASKWGGRVKIKTADAAAREAIHAFLRYQIKEHGTGDPLVVAR